MKDLFDIQKDEDPYIVAICDSCSWKGLPGDCETFEDSEGWEYPTYTVAICPKCELPEIIFFRTSESIKYGLL